MRYTFPLRGRPSSSWIALTCSGAADPTLILVLAEDKLTSIRSQPIVLPFGDSLFERLGRRPGIAAIVDDFVKLVSTDARVSASFAATTGERLEHFRAMVTDQLCEIAGGPCAFAGRDMKTAHHGMAISDVQFDAIIEDLSQAMEMHHVGEADKSVVFLALAKTRDEIVERKSKHQ